MPHADQCWPCPFLHDFESGSINNFIFKMYNFPCKLDAIFYANSHLFLESKTKCCTQTVSVESNFGCQFLRVANLVLECFSIQTIHWTI